MRGLPTELQEEANAAYTFVEHLQAELLDQLRRRNVGQGPGEWEHVELAYRRLERAVKREQELDAQVKEERQRGQTV